MSAKSPFSNPIRPVLECQDVVGESPVWDEHTGCLLWVDIVGRRIHRLHLDSNRHDEWLAPDFVTSVGLRQDDGAIVGLSNRVCLWNYDDQFATFAQPEPDRPGNRLNEGRVAPDGSFWVGTMQNNLDADGRPKEMTASLGAYYRIDPGGTVQRLTENIYGITNTMAWTDGHRFLTADTIANTIYAFRYDDRSKTLGDRSLFAAGFPRGLPDGSCLDAEGYLWNCRVGGGACLVRYAPDGQVDRIVELPCTWPTSCAFGGEDLRTLFVTSARFTMPPEFLAQNPHEGNLWAMDVGVGGCPCHRFGLPNE